MFHETKYWNCQVKKNPHLPSPSLTGLNPNNTAASEFLFQTSGQQKSNCHCRCRRTQERALEGRWRRNQELRMAVLKNGTKTKRGGVGSSPLGCLPRSPRHPPRCRRRHSQASNRKFIAAKLTSVISIFAHCAKCFFVYEGGKKNPFLKLIFHVCVSSCCFFCPHPLLFPSFFHPGTSLNCLFFGASEEGIKEDTTSVEVVGVCVLGVLEGAGTPKRLLQK